FFVSSRRRHTKSVSAFLLNRSSDLKERILVIILLPSIKLRKCSSKIITSILSFISGRLATKSNQIKQLIRNGRSASLQRTFKKRSEERRVGKNSRRQREAGPTKQNR